MGLTRTCLAVCKYCRVLALHEIVDVAGSDFVEKELLRSELAKDTIERVTVFAVINHRSIILVVINLLLMGSESTENTHSGPCVLLLVLLFSLDFLSV